MGGWVNLVPDPTLQPIPMNRVLTSLLLSIGALGANAQINVGGTPWSLRHGLDRSIVPSVRASSFDAEAAASLDAQRATQGAYPADARLLSVEADPNNDGAWVELPNGDAIWRLRIQSDGALATELFFREMQLPSGAVMYIYDDAGEQVLGGFTTFNCKPHGQFATAAIEGEASTVEYYEPAEVRGQGYFRIEKLAHTYRYLGGIERAGDCQVDVNCSEGAGWEAQRDGVVRVRMVENGQIAGFCTGSLVNNVLMDCKPYFLTAHHCGPTVTATDLLDWKFYFKYERTGCGTGSASTSKVMTGAVKRGESNDNGGSSGSDFLLVEAEDPVPNNYTPYWTGWDATTTSHVGGKCIHHPAGDEKKISTYTVTAANSTQWNGLNTHYRVTWVATANGWGVTEGGSSGSALFNSSKRIIGTLTGGGSFCESEQPGGQVAPDWFGRMNYHWTSNGGPASEDLKNWLDPNNSGTLVLDGSYGPCGTLDVASLEAPVRATVYPNPATDLVRVEFPSGSDRLELLDLAGRIVRSRTIVNTTFVDLDVSELTIGAYMVRISANGVRTAAAQLDVIGR